MVLYFDDITETLDKINLNLFLWLLEENKKILNIEKVVVFTHDDIPVNDIDIQYLSNKPTRDNLGSGKKLTHKAAYDWLIQKKPHKNWWHLMNITYKIFNRDVYKTIRNIPAKRKTSMVKDSHIGSDLYYFTSMFLHDNTLSVKNMNIFGDSNKWIKKYISSKPIKSLDFIKKVIDLINDNGITKSWDARPKGLSPYSLLYFWEAAKAGLEDEIKTGIRPKKYSEIIHSLDYAKITDKNK